MPPRYRYPSCSSQDSQQSITNSVSSYGSGRTASTALTAFSDDHAEAAYAFGGTLPCEFVGFHGCDQSFALEDVDGWIEHMILEHLESKLPRKACCWFCDRVFDYKETGGNRRNNFDQRMCHIRDHLAEGMSIQHMRVDHYMNDHLWDHKLIAPEPYAYTSRYSEVPQDKTIIPHDAIPPQMQERQLRRKAKIIDQQEEDRRSRKERGQRRK